MFAWLKKLLRRNKAPKYASPEYWRQRYGIEVPPYPECPTCNKNSNIISAGDSSSTGEARYYCCGCHDHFFSGGWGSGIQARP